MQDIPKLLTTDKIYNIDRADGIASVVRVDENIEVFIARECAE
jgi:hypothetical protein